LISLDQLERLTLLDRHGEGGVFNRQGRSQSPAHLGSKGNSRSGTGTELMTNTKKDVGKMMIW
jgi:hypothetical protein